MTPEARAAHFAVSNAKRKATLEAKALKALEEASTLSSIDSEALYHMSSLIFEL